MAALPSIGRATRVEPARSRGEATRCLYERYHRQIFGFCLNQLGSREEAEDATQSTFLNAHRALEAGKRPDAESAWLFKIAHNVCLSRRRSTFRRRRVESPSDLQTVQDLLAAPQRDGSDDLLRLTDALSHMPDSQRRAILLREWQGLSYREIAGELGLSQAAVETLIFRARRSLIQNLEESQEPVEERVALGRTRKALDFGSLAAALKAAFGTSTAMKAAATAVAVTGAAVAATAPFAHKPHKAAPLERAPAAGVALQSAQHVKPAPAVIRPTRLRRADRAVGVSTRAVDATEKNSAPRLSAPAATAPVITPADQPASPVDPAPVSEPDQAAPAGGSRHGPSSTPPERQPQRTPAGPEPAKPNPSQGHGQGPPSEPPGQQKDKGENNGKGPGEVPVSAAAAAAPGNSGGAPGQAAKPDK